MNCQIGISYGYPTHFPHRRGALDHICQKGIKHIRLCEPFIKGIDTNHQLFANKVKFLINDLGFENILIGIHGLPYSWLPQYDLSVLNETQLAASKWCNRFAPKDWIAYENLLYDFIDTLDSNGVLNKCEFEHGHEPNSSRYYWGALDDFERMIVSNILQQSGRPLYLANFSTELVRDGSKNPEWLNFMNSLEYQSYGFSSSLYWNTRYGKFDVNNNTYPTKPLSSAIISEYNIYTKIPAGSPQEAEFNSPLYVTRLFEMLKFAKSKNISRLYLHDLCSDARDKNGRLGLFELVTINNKKIWMPKEALKQFMKIWDTNVGCAGMVRGFEVFDDRIITEYGKEIVFLEDGSWSIK